MRHVRLSMSRFRNGPMVLSKIGSFPGKILPKYDAVIIGAIRQGVYRCTICIAIAKVHFNGMMN
jgi:hypothetical protein